MSRKDSDKKTDDDLGLGGVFRGLGGFLEVLSDLAEKGAVLQREGNLEDLKKDVKAVYGFSVRVGNAGQPRIERFGNVKPSAAGPVVEETREPMVDVFDEDDHVLVVAELPGVRAEDVRFEVKDDILTLTAASGERRYRKEVLLPASVTHKSVTPTYQNGVLELRLPKAK